MNNSLFGNICWNDLDNHYNNNNNDREAITTNLMSKILSAIKIHLAPKNKNHPLIQIQVSNHWKIGERWLLA